MDKKKLFIHQSSSPSIRKFINIIHYKSVKENIKSNALFYFIDG